MVWFFNFVHIIPHLRVSVYSSVIFYLCSFSGFPSIFRRATRAESFANSTLFVEPARWETNTQQTARGMNSIGTAGQA